MSWPFCHVIVYYLGIVMSSTGWRWKTVKVSLIVDHYIHLLLDSPSISFIKPIQFHSQVYSARVYHSLTLLFELKTLSFYLL